MAANIAKPAFSTGPNDKAVTVDVYGTPPQQPTNTIPGVVNGGIASQNGGKLSFSGNFVSKMLKEVAGDFTKTGKIDLDKAYSKVAGVTGQTTGTIKSKGGFAVNEVLKTFGFYNSTVGQTLDGIAKGAGAGSFQQYVLNGGTNVKALVGGIKADLKDFRDFDSLTALSNMIGSISGDNEFIKIFNLTDTLAVFQSLNKIAVEYNIPGVMDKLIEKLDADDKKAVILGSTKDNNAVSDMKYLETMLDHVDGSTLLASNPLLIEDVLSSYRFDATNPVPTLEMATKLDTLLKRINPRWMYLHSDHQPMDVYNLTLFNVCSAAARTLFLRYDMYTIPLTIASTYGKESFVDLAKANYKYLSF